LRAGSFPPPVRYFGKQIKNRVRWQGVIRQGKGDEEQGKRPDSAAQPGPQAPPAGNLLGGLLPSLPPSPPRRGSLRRLLPLPGAAAAPPPPPAPLGPGSAPSPGAPPPGRQVFGRGGESRGQSS